MIDLSTVILIFILVMFVNTAVILIFWMYLKKQMPFLEYWLISFFLYGVGLILYDLNGALDSTHLSVTSTAFVLISIVLGAAGTFRLLKYKMNYVHIIPLFIGLVSLVYLNYFSDQITPRIVIVTAVSVYYYLLQYIFLLPRRSFLKNRYLVPMSSVMLLFVIVGVFRIIVALVDATNVENLYSQSSMQLLIANLILYIAVGYGASFVIYGIYEHDLMSIQVELEQNELVNKRILESENKYRQLFNQTPLGIATHQIIFDDSHKPVDYIILNVNKGYEKQTGLKKEDIESKRVTEVIPDVEQFWIRRFGYVVSAQRSTRFIDYSKPLDKYFSVVAYPIDKDQFAVIAEDITLKRNNEQQIEYLATHDQLTGLENRQALHQLLDQLKVTSDFKPIVYAFDINALNIYNEAFGYDVGDKILIEVAEIIKKVIRKESHAYRIDGDLFVILGNAIGLDINVKSKELLEALEKITYGNIDLSVTYAYLINEDPELSGSDLIKEVEKKVEQKKLYEEKSHKSNSVKTILATLTSKYDDERIHSARVSKYCEKIAKKLGFDETDTARLKLAGMTHDIGKIAIPDEILHKPAKLTDEEYAIIKTHAETGYKILSAAKEYHDIALAARHHHERWDGKGYPVGLKGEEIPLFSRIICVLDAFEAMTSDRVYHKAQSEEYAINELLRCSGTQFDAKIVDIFIEVLYEMKQKKNRK